MLYAIIEVLKYIRASFIYFGFRFSEFRNVLCYKYTRPKQIIFHKIYSLRPSYNQKHNNNKDNEHENIRCQLFFILLSLGQDFVTKI